MPSLSPKDRAPLCLFSYEDGRRCRTPRKAHHPHFCFYHAQKESQSQAAEKLSEDLAYFFSGDYLSACDLSTALSRLIPAVVRGDIKPKLARTVAYMFQTQLQAIHLSQREYVNAFGADSWRKVLRSSVRSNHKYLFPPDPSESAPAPQPPATAPPSQHVAPPPQAPSRPQQPAPATPQPPSATRPSPAATEAALSVARSMFPQRPDATPAPPAEPTPIPAVQTPPPTPHANHPATQTAQPNHATPPVSPRPPPTPPNRD